MQAGASYNLIVILGPTASGKTAVAVRLAKELGSEIISADSRQVYTGMNVGTGKDLSEYIMDGTTIPCHLIDIVDPTYEFSVFEYQRRFLDVFEKISGRNIMPVMAGGTGLYIESVLSGYDMTETPVNEALRKTLEVDSTATLGRRLQALNPQLHNSTDLLDKKRIIRAIEIAEFAKTHNSGHRLFPRITPLIIGIRWERAVLRERITRRLKERLKSGMVEEVESLHSAGVGWDTLDFFGLEYRFVGQYLQGRLNHNDMFQKLNTAIHKFAKRQETWFRRMEKKGTEINWIDEGDYQKVRGLVFSELNLPH